MVVLGRLSLCSGDFLPPFMVAFFDESAAGWCDISRCMSDLFTVGTVCKMSVLGGISLPSTSVDDFREIGSDVFDDDVVSS